MKVIDLEFIDGTEEFARTQYDDFEVIVMVKNGYVNVSKLCKDHGLKLENWLKRDSSKELINKIKELDVPMIVIQNDYFGNKTGSKGTYVNKLLVPHICSWISPSFAIKVSKIINNQLLSPQDALEDAVGKYLTGLFDKQETENLLLDK